MVECLTVKKKKIYTFQLISLLQQEYFHNNNNKKKKNKNMPSTADPGWNGERKPTLPSMVSGGVRSKSKKMISTVVGFEVMRWNRKFSKGLIEFKMTANPKGGNATAALLPKGCNSRSDWAVSKLNDEACATSPHFRDVGTTMCAHICHDEKKISWYAGSDIKDTRLVSSQPIRLDMLPVTAVFSTFGSNVRVEIADISDKLFKRDPEIMRMDKDLLKEADHFRAKMKKETPTSSPSLSCAENPMQKEMISELETQRETLQSEKDELEGTNGSLKGEVETLTVEVEQKTSRISSLAKQLETVRAANSSLEDQLKNREDNRKENLDRCNDQEMDIMKLTKKVSSLETSLEEERATKLELVKSEEGIKEKLSHLEQTTTSNDLLNKVTREMSELQVGNDRLELELAAINENFDREKAKKNKLLRENSQHELLIADLKGQILMLGKIKKSGDRGTPKTPRQEYSCSSLGDDGAIQLRQQLEDALRVRTQQEVQIAELKGQVLMMSKMKVSKLSVPSSPTRSLASSFTDVRTPISTPRELFTDQSNDIHQQEISELRNQLRVALMSDDDDHNSKLQILQNENSFLKQQISDNHGNQSSPTTTSIGSDQEIADLKNDLRVALLTDDDDFNAKMAILQDKIKSLETANTISPHHIKSLEAKISSLENENKELRQDGTPSTTDTSQLQSQIVELENQLRNALSINIDDENIEIKNLRHKIASLEVENENLQQTNVVDHNDDENELIEKIKILETAAFQMVAGKQDDNNNIDRLQQDNTALKEQILLLESQHLSNSPEANPVECEDCKIHTIENDHLRLENDSLKGQTNHIDSDVLQNENNELKAQLRIALMTDDDDHNAAMNVLHDKISALESKLATATPSNDSEISNLKLQNEILQTRCEHQDSDIERLVKNVEILEQDLRSAQSPLKSFSTTRNDVQISELEETNKKLEQQLHVALFNEDAEDEINELKSKIEILEKDCNETQERLQLVLTDDGEVEELHERISQLEGENNFLKQQSECDSLSLSTTHKEDPNKIHLIQELSSAKELNHIKEKELTAINQQYQELHSLRESETCQFMELAKDMQHQMQVLKEQLATEKKAPESQLLTQLATLDSCNQELKNDLEESQREVLSLKNDVEMFKADMKNQTAEHATLLAAHNAKELKLKTALSSLQEAQQLTIEVEQVTSLKGEITELRSEMAIMVSDHADKLEQHIKEKKTSHKSHKDQVTSLNEKTTMLSEQLQTVKIENREKIDKLTVALEKANARSQCFQLTGDIYSPEKLNKSSEIYEPRQTFQRKWLNGLRLSTVSECTNDDRPLQPPDNSPPAYPQGDDSYSYEDLRLPSSLGQFTIDVTKRESYLSDDEFKKIFSIPKITFYMLPSWKQVRMKRKLCLI